MNSNSCKSNFNLRFITPPAPRAKINCSNQALLGRTITIPNTYTDILTFNPSFNVPTLVKVEVVPLVGSPGDAERGHSLEKKCY